MIYVGGWRSRPVVYALLIDSFAFGVHYVVLAAICLLGLLPLARMTETVEVAK